MRADADYDATRHDTTSRCQNVCTNDTVPDRTKPLDGRNTRTHETGAT